MREKFPNHTLREASDGVILRKFGKKWWPVCAHGELLKSCKNCNDKETKVLTERIKELKKMFPESRFKITVYGMISRASGSSKKWRRVCWHGVRPTKCSKCAKQDQFKKSEELIRNMRKKFPQYDLRVSRQGHVTRRFKNSWKRVCQHGSLFHRPCKSCNVGTCSHGNPSNKPCPECREEILLRIQKLMKELQEAQSEESEGIE